MNFFNVMFAFLHYYHPPPPTPTTNTQLTHSQIRRTFARFVYIFSHFNLKMVSLCLSFVAR